MNLSFVRVHQDQVFDLLNDGKSLTIKDDSNSAKAVILKGLLEMRTNLPEELAEAIQNGFENLV